MFFGYFRVFLPMNWHNMKSFFIFALGFAPLLKILFTPSAI